MTNFLKSNKLYFWISITAVVLVIIISLYKFYLKQDYTFMVEVTCDPSIEECSHRDCSLDECPPNELEDYLTYSIKASDFKECLNDDCSNFCRDSDKCVPVQE